MSLKNLGKFGFDQMLSISQDKTTFLAGLAAGAFLALVGTELLKRTYLSIKKKKEKEFNEESRKFESPFRAEGTKSVLSLAEEGDEIISEQFTRNIQFFGKEGQLKIHGSFVIVVGLGGVGSHAVAMLLRSGIGKIRIIDFDLVSVSSLNRHAVATRSDVGTPKATCLKNHFQKIFPEAEIDSRVEMFEASTSDELLSGDPAFVLDCIDNIDTKVALLAACVRKNIRVLCATGAGARADPTRIRIADLRESTMDPLSRTVRSRLKRDHGIESGIQVVFSTEKPKAKLLPFEGTEESSQNPLDFQIVPGFRVRILPVLGTIPAMFGQAMATFVLCSLAGLEINPEPVFSLNLEQFSVIRRRLEEREELNFGSTEAIELDMDEIAYVVREVWRGRSARAQDRVDPGKGMWRSINNLTLTRWNIELPPTIDNLVLLTFDEAEHHESTTLENLKIEEPEFVASTEARLKRLWVDY